MGGVGARSGETPDDDDARESFDDRRQRPPNQSDGPSPDTGEQAERAFERHPGQARPCQYPRQAGVAQPYGVADSIGHAALVCFCGVADREAAVVDCSWRTLGQRRFAAAFCAGLQRFKWGISLELILFSKNVIRPVKA